MTGKAFNIYQAMKALNAVCVVHDGCSKKLCDAIIWYVMPVEDRRKGATENEMVGWHHRINRHELEQILGAGKGQENLVCCCPRGRKE